MTLALAFALATRSRNCSASPAGVCSPSSPLCAKPSREHEALGDRDIGNPPIFDRSAITSTDFYGNSPNPTEPNPLWYPTGYVYESSTKIPDIVFPYNEYGNYCLNCHASAENELTFASLDNMLGPGLRYKQFGPVAPSYRHRRSWVSRISCTHHPS